MAKKSKSKRTEEPEVEFQRLEEGSEITVSFATTKAAETKNGAIEAAYLTGCDDDEGTVFSTFSKNIVKQIDNGDIEPDEDGTTYEVVGKSMGKGYNPRLSLKEI